MNKVKVSSFFLMKKKWEMPVGDVSGRCHQWLQWAYLLALEFLIEELVQLFLLNKG